MKTLASIALAATLSLVGAAAQDTCDLPKETLDAISFPTIAKACEYIASDQSYDTCDACLGSIVGNLLLPLYPSLDLDVTTFPTSPSALAAQLASGDDLGLSALNEGGACTEYLNEQAAAADADIQAYFFSIIGCDPNVPWGPKVVEAVTEFDPNFVPAA